MECLYLVYYHFAEARRGAIAFNQDPNVGLVSFIQNNPAVTERVFVASYKQIISPKTGCITKEGLETRASNLMLILIVTQREAIQAYFAQRYASILQKEPNLLAGVLSDQVRFRLHGAPRAGGPTIRCSCGSYRRFRSTRKP